MARDGRGGRRHTLIPGVPYAGVIPARRNDTCVWNERTCGQLFALQSTVPQPLRMPRRAESDPPMPLVVTRGEALAVGLTRDQIRQRIRSGRWRILAHGVYCRGAPTLGVQDHVTARMDHALRAQAEVLSFTGSVAALHSAAVLRGLPLWRPLPRDVALTVPLGSWNGTRPGVILHRFTLDEGDVEDGRIPLTSTSRTCMDVARLSSIADGFAVSDAALRAGLVTHDALVDVADRIRDPRGRHRSRLVARHASGLRESPAESASWAYFLRHRLPLPAMQVRLESPSGTFIARVDFWWERVRLVGECDGRMKYQSPDDLYDEKRREDAIRAAGHPVVRWTPQDLRDGALAARLRRLLV